MSLEHKVVELEKQDEQEYMEIIIQAFRDSPQMPALITKPKQTTTILFHLLKLYEKTGTIKVFGIKKNDMMICVGLCVDSDVKPGVSQLMKFAVSILLNLGFHGLYQFWAYNKNKPHYEKKYLELLFYGTHTSYQQQGYGASLLQYLYRYAKENGYGGVIGVTNTSRPAFRFYKKTGWVVDKEFQVENYTICWVRYIV